MNLSHGHFLDDPTLHHGGLPIQQRLRILPSRVVVYVLLAAALFEECGTISGLRWRFDSHTSRLREPGGVCGRGVVLAA